MSSKPFKLFLPRATADTLNHEPWFTLNHASRKQGLRNWGLFQLEWLDHQVKKILPASLFSSGCGALRGLWGGCCACEKWNHTGQAPCVRWTSCAAAATRTADGWVRGGADSLGAAFGGSWATYLAVFPPGEGARSCRATKTACERSRESNFWLPRVAARGSWPELVVARQFGLVTKPTP
jgi:hypothetical protein